MDIEALRVAIYRSFATTGEAPTRAELAADLDTSQDAVVAGIRELAGARHLALSDDGEIVMAHPFASIPLGFAAMGKSTLWWGGCAWDSFALAHLVPDQAPVLVSTRCPGCGKPMAWNVDTQGPPPGDEVAHFLVPSAHMWDDVVHTCRHQNLFCSVACIESWLAATDNHRGYVMDLTTLWQLASGWYSGRLEYGYVRREPNDAADYLRASGLHGSFWGL
jgi:hypothetical protein